MSHQSLVVDVFIELVHVRLHDYTIIEIFKVYKMDRSTLFSGPDPDDNGPDRVVSPRHKRIVYIIYGLGIVLSTVLFFTITNMKSWSNRIMYVMSVLLLGVNAWLSSNYIDDLPTEYRMFREVEQNASDMIPYIITIAVLAVTLSRTDEYDCHFKYSILVAIISLIAVVLVIWIPENNKWIIRYMRDLKTVFFTIGALFGMSSVYSIVAGLPTGPPRKSEDTTNTPSANVPRIPKSIDSDIMADDISPLETFKGTL